MEAIALFRRKGEKPRKLYLLHETVFLNGKGDKVLLSRLQHRKQKGKWFAKSESKFYKEFKPLKKTNPNGLSEDHMEMLKRRKIEQKLEEAKLNKKIRILNKLKRDREKNGGRRLI